MQLYDRYVLPYLIDFACGLPMVQAQRRQLVPQAQGRVLEVGMGTGRNWNTVLKLAEMAGVKT